MRGFTSKTAFIFILFFCATLQAKLIIIEHNPHQISYPFTNDFVKTLDGLKKIHSFKLLYERLEKLPQTHYILLYPCATPKINTDIVYGAAFVGSAQKLPFLTQFLKPNAKDLYDFFIQNMQSTDSLLYFPYFIKDQSVRKIYPSIIFHEMLHAYQDSKMIEKKTSRVSYEPQHMSNTLKKMEVEAHILELLLQKQGLVDPASDEKLENLKKIQNIEILLNVFKTKCILPQNKSDPSSKILEEIWAVLKKKYYREQSNHPATHVLTFSDLTALEELFELRRCEKQK